MKRFELYENRYVRTITTGIVSLAVGFTGAAIVTSEVNKSNLNAVRAAGVAEADQAYKDGEQAANAKFCTKLGKAVMSDTADMVYKFAWKSRENAHGMIVETSKDGSVISLTLSGQEKIPSTAFPGAIYRNSKTSGFTLVLGANSDKNAKPQIMESGGIQAETVKSDGSVEYNGAGGETTILEGDGSAASQDAVERIQRAASSGDPTELADAFNEVVSPRDAKYQPLPSTFLPAKITVADTTSYSEFDLSKCVSDENVRDGISGIVLYDQPQSGYLDEALAVQPTA